MQNYEQRKHLKLKEKYQVLTKILDKEGTSQSDVVSGYAIDISKGGIRFHAEAPLPEKARLRVNITIRDPFRVITRVGRVIWVNRLISDTEHYEIGVSFERSDDLDSPLWDQYVDRNIDLAV